MMGKPLQMNRFVRLSTVGSFASLYLYILIVQTNKMSSTLVAVSHGDASRSPSGWGWPTRQDSRYADSSALPTWLSEYFDWHNRMRHKYPGDKILTDPKAPGVIIKNCAYKCGGLHDRLGHLGERRQPNPDFTPDRSHFVKAGTYCSRIKQGGFF